jgi:3-oxoacyl-[acyl-carrier-protein] synthase III
MRPRDIDLVLPSQLPDRFPDTLGRRLELPGDRIARVGEGLRGVHTAGPVAALEAAERSGLLAEAEHVLFVAVGAGISVGMALYRRPG